MAEMSGDQPVREAGPVEQGVRAFLAKTAHEDPAMSALSLAAAQSVDEAPAGSRSHAYAVESLRKVLSNLQATAKPERDDDDEFAELLGEVFAR